MVKIWTVLSSLWKQGLGKWTGARTGNGESSTEEAESVNSHRNDINKDDEWFQVEDIVGRHIDKQTSSSWQTLVNEYVIVNYCSKLSVQIPKLSLLEWWFFLHLCIDSLEGWDGHLDTKSAEIKGHQENNGWVFRTTGSHVYYHKKAPRATHPESKII